MRLEKQLKDHFLDLVRHLLKVPHDFEIIKQIKSNINSELNDIVHCVKCLRIIYLKKLSTAAEEEESHIRQLTELKEKISSYEKTKN